MPQSLPNYHVGLDPPPSMFALQTSPITHFHMLRFRFATCNRLLEKYALGLGLVAINGDGISILPPPNYSIATSNPSHVFKHSLLVLAIA